MYERTIRVIEIGGGAMVAVPFLILPPLDGENHVSERMRKRRAGPWPSLYSTAPARTRALGPVTYF